MMAWRPGVLLVGAVLIAASVAWAEETDDLDRIPVPDPSVDIDDRPAATGWRIYAEQALTLPRFRDDLVVPPPRQRHPDWQERLSLDARRTWSLDPQLKATYSGRLNLLAEDGGPFPDRTNLRHDFREGFLSWEPAAQDYLDLGRINLRSGVAIGFSPTDFFKTRAVVDRVSNDPSVLRENRLGTVMLRGLSVGEGGAVTLAYAPPLADPSPVYSGTLPSLDPMFDRTNADHRFLLKFNRDLVGDLSPELLLYRDGSRTRLGANVTHELGGGVIAYAEWAGGNRASLVEEADRYGRKTGTIPAAAPRILPGDRSERFYSDLSVGGSYTTDFKVMINLEYHYHGAGLSRQDWRNWIDIGGANAGVPAVTSQLWYLRSYALEQQEPLTRHTVFLRAEWNDAFVPGLKLAGLTSVNLYDGSRLVQVTADYFWSDLWTFGVLAASSSGGSRSERGSTSQAHGVIFKAARYF